MKKQHNIFWGIAYGYILLPFIIFLLGWIKIYIALPITITLCYCFYRICKESPQLWMPIWNRENVFKIIFIIGIIFIWVYYSGIGKFVFQNTDHEIRNGIFNILVEYQWPVINYEVVPKYNPALEGSNATGLIYYIGFWLPSALVGKIMGLQIGYYFQAVWAVLGIALIYYLICAMFKKVTVWPLFVLIFFSGLDIIGILLTGINPMDYGSKMHLEWWGTPYQYSSMTTQLFWVFNQSIPAWVCTMLAYIQKNNRNLFFLLACSMLTSTLPFVGLLMLVSFFCFSRIYGEGNGNKGKNIGSRIKEYFCCLVEETCTVQNIVGGGIIGILSFLYLMSNSSASVIMGENIKGPEFDNSIAKYIIFLILEIGIYGVLIYKYHKEDKLFYFIIVCLCIIPPIKVGYSVDFCMRASIPALFLLMILVMRTLTESWEKKDYKVFVSLLLVLAIGSCTPICEFKRTFTETFQRIKDGERVCEEDNDMVEILNSPNFSGDIEGNIFFKYFVK